MTADMALDAVRRATDAMRDAVGWTGHVALRDPELNELDEKAQTVLIAVAELIRDMKGRDETL